MASSYLDYFIHAANILLLGAYSVRDILWLRVLAVASSLAAIPRRRSIRRAGPGDAREGRAEGYATAHT